MNKYFIVKDNKIFGNSSSGGRYFNIVTTTPAFTVVGGTVTTSGIHTLHTFTGSGTLTITGSGDIDYLIIGGGSGSKSEFAVGNVGGGGAGGDLKEIFNYNISAGIYTVTVGAGGAKFTNQAGVTSSISGVDSALGAPQISATFSPRTGKNSRNKTGGAQSTTARAGGGASHNQDGGNATSNKGGNGGLGTLSTITGLAYTGGGGGGASSTNGGDGNDGGGNGGGAFTVNGSSGAVNTGGGGGGKSQAAFTDGGNGGSGLVVIRFVTP